MSARRVTDGLWTPADLAAFLQMAEKTLREWRHKRKGPPYMRMGKHVRYDPAAIRAWLDTQTSADLDDHAA